MHPVKTRYRLARPEDDYFMDLMEHGDVPRRFPTVVAERDGHIVGFLATDARADFICAGPLSVSPDAAQSRGILAMRLIQAYEAVLLQAQGVEGYYFMGASTPWIAATQRCENTFRVRDCDNGLSLFWRELPTPDQLMTVH